MDGEGVEWRKKKKCKYSGINDDFISIVWQMLLSLYDKLPPVPKANSPHNKWNCDSVLLYSDINPLAPGFATQLTHFQTLI